MPIRVLDPTVAAQIAAGEVVERPASVVKELVENALDAGARRISVSVRGGGIDELTIQDDGTGIPADQVELAFARHATSKLATAEDLWAIGTLGFRGEALPSIAAVAQVICTTRTADADVGIELRIAGGELQSRAPRGCSVGTTLSVRNLFYNIPVRREFLKTPAAEATAISSVLTQYALAYPDRAFSLMRDGKRVLQTSGAGRLIDVVLELYGVDVARQMLPIDVAEGDELAAVCVQGLVSAPSITRAARDGMHLTVNGRAVQPRGLLSLSIEEAYHTLLMKGRFPLVVLHIQVHPAAVDVNVHPTKSEVKFRQPQRVGRLLGRAVREAVQGNVVIQGWDDGTSALVDAAMDAPDSASATDSGEAGADGPLAPHLPAAVVVSDASSSAPALAAPTAVAGADITPVQAALLASPAPAARAASPRDMPLATEAAPGWDAADERAEAADRSDADAPRRQAALQALNARGQGAPGGASAPLAPQPAADIVVVPVPERDDGQSAPVAAAREPGLSPLRALAQFAQTYVLAEGPAQALYLIDQHAAHERITYERLMAQHSAGVIEAQTLLLAQHVPLPPAATQTLCDAVDALSSWGFALERDERTGVQVLAVPGGLPLAALPATLADLASHLVGSGGRTPAEQREQVLTTLACHTSVRAGQTLTLAEQQALLDQLSGCEGPRTCPHGRPTVLVLTQQQLARQFGRLGA
jgi:DNA mismatch repair protein MutL